LCISLLPMSVGAKPPPSSIPSQSTVTILLNKKRSVLVSSSENKRKPAQIREVIIPSLHWTELHVNQKMGKLNV
jgi:hypothetical protein